MESREILEKISNDFNKEGFDAALQPANDAIPWDIVQVFLGQDRKSREQIIEITCKKQVLGEKIKKEFFSIQLAAFLPFHCQDASLSDLNSLILYLNRQLDLPGFEMSELEAKPLFRTVQLTSGLPDSTVMLSLAGMIGLYLTLYSELLETVATGDKNFNNILEEILEA